MYRNTTDSRGLLSDLHIGLGLKVHETGSGYGSFTSPNGRRFTIRISNHNIGTSNIKGDPVESIIIKTKKSPNRFKAMDGKFADEYTYFKEDISNAPVGTLSSIVDSIYNLLDTGIFEDKTGLAKHSHSPERTSDEGVMFRDGSPVKARDLYEKKVKSSRFQAREALQDSMLGLKTMMESVMKGEDVVIMMPGGKVLNEFKNIAISICCHRARTRYDGHVGCQMAKNESFIRRV